MVSPSSKSSSSLRDPPPTSPDRSSVGSLLGRSSGRSSCHSSVSSLPPRRPATSRFHSDSTDDSLPSLDPQRHLPPPASPSSCSAHSVRPPLRIRLHRRRNASASLSSSPCSSTPFRCPLVRSSSSSRRSHSRSPSQDGSVDRPYLIDWLVFANFVFISWFGNWYIIALLLWIS